MLGMATAFLYAACARSTRNRHTAFLRGIALTARYAQLRRARAGEEVGADEGDPIEDGGAAGDDDDDGLAANAAACAATAYVATVCWRFRVGAPGATASNTMYAAPLSGSSRWWGKCKLVFRAKVPGTPRDATMNSGDPNPAMPCHTTAQRKDGCRNSAADGTHQDERGPGRAARALRSQGHRAATSGHGAHQSPTAKFPILAHGPDRGIGGHNS